MHSFLHKTFDGRKIYNINVFHQPAWVEKKEETAVRTSIYNLMHIIKTHQTVPTPLSSLVVQEVQLKRSLVIVVADVDAKGDVVVDKIDHRSPCGVRSWVGCEDRRGARTVAEARLYTCESWIELALGRHLVDTLDASRYHIAYLQWVFSDYLPMMP